MKKKIKPSHTDQHVIPNFYLKAWKDPQFDYKVPHIWVNDNNTHQCEHKPTKTNFTLEDFYTVYSESGERQLHIEHTLDKVEAEFSKLRKEKLLLNLPLDFNDKLAICKFLATMHNRTVSKIDHIKTMFEPLFDKLKKIAINTNATTTEELKVTICSKSGDIISSITMDEIDEITKNPLDHIMSTFIEHEIKTIIKLDMAIFYSNNNSAFITSDNPCVWYAPDEESPELNNKLLNIILPISPTHCILLNKKGLNGYIDTDTNLPTIDSINEIIYDASEKVYIANNEAKVMK